MSNPVLDQAPADPLMLAPWLGCLRWSLTEAEIVERFRADTGCTFTPGKTGLEQLIDEKTGAMDDFMQKYVAWFNENVWGKEDGPEPSPALKSPPE